jgi:hypothetical protein
LAWWNRPRSPREKPGVSDAGLNGIIAQPAQLELRPPRFRREAHLARRETRRVAAVEPAMTSREKPGGNDAGLNGTIARPTTVENIKVVGKTKVSTRHSNFVIRL